MMEINTNIFHETLNIKRFPQHYRHAPQIIHSIIRPEAQLKAAE